MKTTKIILLITTISLLTWIPYGVANAGDCSNAKGFHAKMVCKLTGKTSSSATAAETKVTNEDGSASWIKKFLGKKNNKVTGN